MSEVYPDCDKRLEDRCTIAEQLAGINCIVQPKACEACLVTSHPACRNRVTVGLATISLIRAGMIKESREVAASLFPVTMKKKKQKSFPEPRIKPNGSKIGTLLKEIIQRETGHDIPCGECKEEVERLDKMNSTEVLAEIKPLSEKILNRSKDQSQRWYHKLAVMVIPEYVTAEIRKWIREACQRSDAELEVKYLRWSYGITTVPSRRDNLFPKTMESLLNAGFDKPRIFVDGVQNSFDYDHWNLPVTTHFPVLRTAGNWLISLWELYMREPTSDRYAIFQDDFMTVRNLKRYLELSKYPERGYLNLYTFPSNQKLAPSRDYIGWYEANQLGRGAVALVFSNEAVRMLVGSPYFVDRFNCPDRGHRAVDGGIVESLKRVPGGAWKEYVHTPSLTQHLGDKSSMGNGRQLKALTFPGENFDALTLLE